MGMLAEERTAVVRSTRTGPEHGVVVGEVNGVAQSAARGLQSPGLRVLKDLQSPRKSRLQRRRVEG